MTSSVLKMTNFVFKTQHRTDPATAAVSKNDEFVIQNEEFCIKNEEFCIKNDELCSSEAIAALKGASTEKVILQKVKSWIADEKPWISY